MELDSKGLLGTAIFHTLLLMLFILFGFVTPLPLPEEAGILINFGDSETGLGSEEPRMNSQPTDITETQSVPETSETVNNEDPVLTQNTEEAPAMKTVTKPKDKKIENKKENIVKTPTPEVKKEEKKVKEEPKLDTRALYSGKKDNSTGNTSQGNTYGTGNQGSLTGSPDATNYGLGSGTGDKPGFYLEGRNYVSLPKPSEDVQKEGKVVVQIKVDREGNVVEAVPGAKGSTTLDSYLLGVAKKAALSSKFDSKPDAPYVQVGTITYIFRFHQK